MYNYHIKDNDAIESGSVISIYFDISQCLFAPHCWVCGYECPLCHRLFILWCKFEKFTLLWLWYGKYNSWLPIEQQLALNYCSHILVTGPHQTHHREIRITYRWFVSHMWPRGGGEDNAPTPPPTTTPTPTHPASPAPPQLPPPPQLTPHPQSSSKLDWCSAMSVLLRNILIMFDDKP